MHATQDVNIWTPSPTPPLPIRNPNHRSRYSPWHPLPPLPDSASKIDLVPMPLFSKRSRLPPRTLHVIVHDIPPSPSSKSDSPYSPAASFRSSSSSVSSSPPTSAPGSPSSRPASLTYAFPPPDVERWGTNWEPAPAPRHCLRRKPSPRKESLRSLRTKESEACLQRAYDQQLDAYLSGSLFRRAKWKEDLGMVEEE